MEYNYKYLNENDLLTITFLISTLENVHDVAREEEEHMATSEIILLPSTIEEGK